MIKEKYRDKWLVIVFILLLGVLSTCVQLSSLPEQPNLAKAKENCLEVKLLGLITIKENSEKKIPIKYLVPGGQSIGVYLKTPGVMVVGFSDVKTKDGEINPAREAKLKEGDLIFKVNDLPVNHEFELKNLINHLGGQKITLTIKRGKETFKREINPVYSDEEKRWRIGVFIRDNIAGLGTLSYYNPQDKTFGALGHTIIDPDTGKVFPVQQGKIVEAKIQAIYPSRRGQPGEKIGKFIHKNIVGTVYLNNRFGIFGKASQEIINPYFPKPVPIAFKEEVKPGPAEIYTVVKGEKIEKFTVYVEKVRPYQKDGRNLILRIKDPRLLSLTGGIVQGMSGSPIIKEGKFIGVVTHVFLSDSSKGYGILIENMLKEVYNSNNFWVLNSTFSFVKYCRYFSEKNILSIAGKRFIPSKCILGNKKEIIRRRGKWIQLELSSLMTTGSFVSF
ncbi:SpoIVB peptidase [Carboxydothermus hydrogenoformans]|uniref:Putative stage IV sporulation protein B n=1 Tax=Carboxydothermus hydrogenoformans (strain ATCC BAA-161 / DSM 6008 / Z-2901) TaxID=246194 RepID=Q3AAN6_CARHZ|nr:SpoIVB peptidase [Carboxydothermus hydrogenoformans]ABB13652.1 putative stage IV sporulation protein B [Carboxydothermus hydrogenoformans Z-2901]